jgi:hypothetical protein
MDTKHFFSSAVCSNFPIRQTSYTVTRQLIYNNGELPVNFQQRPEYREDLQFLKGELNF